MESKLEKNLNRLGVIIGIGMLTIIIMTMSSCRNTKEMKKCCEKTANEVYKYEGEYINK